MVDITHEARKPISDELIRGADVVITLGHEAHVEPAHGTPVENWDTDEPSERGIEDVERLRLIRDDITSRARRLAADLAIGPQ